MQISPGKELSLRHLYMYLEIVAGQKTAVVKHAIVAFLEQSPRTYPTDVLKASKLSRSSKDTKCQQMASKKVITLKVQCHCLSGSPL